MSTDSVVPWVFQTSLSPSLSDLTSSLSDLTYTASPPSPSPLYCILDLVLRFLLDGLRIPPVATQAAKAVQSVCQKCKDKMAPHFDGLVQVSQLLAIIPPYSWVPSVYILPPKANDHEKIPLKITALQFADTASSRLTVIFPLQIIEAADNLGIANDAIVGLLKGNHYHHFFPVSLTVAIP